MITVACVLKSGGIYDWDWVARLRRGVERNLSSDIDYRFVVLTDDMFNMNVECEMIQLLHGWKGWWSKIELFRPGLFPGRVLYLDLDSIVVGSLDPIAMHPHDFTMAHEFYRPHMMCSTAMAWDGRQDFGIYAEFLDNTDAIMRSYDARRSDRKIGDQGFIEDHLACMGVVPQTFKELFGERSIASYKVHKCQLAPPSDAAVVAFHGKPKPHEMTDGWVADYWRNAHGDQEPLRV